MLRTRQDLLNAGDGVLWERFLERVGVDGELLCGSTVTIVLTGVTVAGSFSPASAVTALPWFPLGRFVTAWSPVEQGHSSTPGHSAGG